MQKLIDELQQEVERLKLAEQNHQQFVEQKHEMDNELAAFEEMSREESQPSSKDQQEEE